MLAGNDIWMFPLITQRVVLYSAAKAAHEQSRIEREDAAKRCLMNNMMEHRLRVSSVSEPQINVQQEGAKQVC